MTEILQCNNIFNKSKGNELNRVLFNGCYDMNDVAQAEYMR